MSRFDQRFNVILQIFNLIFEFHPNVCQNIFSFINSYGDTARERHKIMGQFTKLSLGTVDSHIDESSVASDLAASTLAVPNSAAPNSAPPSSAPPSPDSPSSASPSSADTKNERFDGFEDAHWPFNDDKPSQSRCKLKGCSGLTHIYCAKCSRQAGKNINLCFTRSRNCFVNYHDPNY